jgi:hypothetical protein
MSKSVTVLTLRNEYVERIFIIRSNDENIFSRIGETRFGKWYDAQDKSRPDSFYGIVDVSVFANVETFEQFYYRYY